MNLSSVNVGVMVEIGILLGVGLLVILIVWAQWLSEQKRRKNLTEVSRRIGFYFSPEPREDTLSELGVFKLFRTGHSHEIFNVLQGNWKKIEWLVFDYKYTVGRGRSSRIHNQTVAYVNLDSFKFPPFYLGPESLINKIGEVLGFKDIDFKNYPEFSQRYLLKSPEEENIRNLFTPQVLRAFEKNEEKINIEAEGNKFIYYSLDKRIDPRHLRAFLDNAAEFLSLLVEKSGY